MSVSALLEKFREYFETHKMLVIWVGTVLIISTLVIIGILYRRNQNQPKPLALVETPLKYDVAHSLVVGDEIIEETDFPERLEVFDLVSKNYHQDVDAFLADLKRTDYKKTAIQTSLYIWTKGENYLEYVPDSQNLYFTFVDAVETSIDVRVNSSESAGNYLSSFYKNFFSRDYEFLNVKFETQGNRIRIEGNRNVNGLPLYVRGHSTYTDYLELDSQGNLYEGNLLLVEHLPDSGEQIELVDISNLQFVVGQADYPKEIFQLHGPSHDDEVENEQEHPQGDRDEFVEVPDIASKSILDSVQLVYYFSDVSFKKLSPTFRIESEGSIRENGETLQVPLLIYTNALDPDRVYVPGDED